MTCGGEQILEPWGKPLYDGFEHGGFSSLGGLYFKNNPEQDAGTVEFQNEITYRGKGALRLTVGPLQDRKEQGLRSQRAEIWERKDLWVPYDRGIWYGFAVKFAAAIPQDDHRYVIAQWKRQISGTKGDFSPFLALRLNKGKLFATVETNLVTSTHLRPKARYAKCPNGEAAVWLRPETNQTRALVATDATWTREDGDYFNVCTSEIAVTNRGNPLPSPRSGWIEFAIYTRPGPDGSGHIEIFANHKWIVTIRGRIGHSEKGLGKHQYFKFGPYRANHSNTWTLYYDEFRRSRNCADILKAPCPLCGRPSLGSF
ncbi:MAG TPA: polysaccharide lyase [Aestuariivirgaceae bacterium]